MKSLVAYYSRTGENYFGGDIRTITEGNTEKAAKEIAKLTGADLFEIRQSDPYSDTYMTYIQQAQDDSNAHCRPKIENLPASLDEYDEIWLGFPIYWDTMPMAVFTFIHAYDWNGKIIHPFTTHEGSGLGRVPADLAKEAKGAIITQGLAIHASYVDRSKAQIDHGVKVSSTK